MVILLFFVIVIAFIYRSPRLVIQLESPSFSLPLIMLCLPFLWTFSSPVGLGAIVRQTDSPPIHISRSIPRFVWFCGLLTTGRLQPSTALRCFSLFLFLHLAPQPGSHPTGWLVSTLPSHDAFEPVFVVISPSPFSTSYHLKT